MMEDLAVVARQLQTQSVIVCGGKPAAREALLESIVAAKPNGIRVFLTKSHPKDSESVLKSFYREIIQPLDPVRSREVEGSLDRINDVYTEVFDKVTQGIWLVLPEWGALARHEPVLFADFVSEFLTCAYLRPRFRLLMTLERLPDALEKELRLHIGTGKPEDPVALFRKHFTIVPLTASL